MKEKNKFINTGNRINFKNSHPELQYLMLPNGEKTHVIVWIKNEK